MLKKAFTYLREVREEFGKVMWPSRAELLESSSIVAILSLILAVFTFSIDFIVNRVLNLIF